MFSATLKQFPVEAVYWLRCAFGDSPGLTAVEKYTVDICPECSQFYVHGGYLAILGDLFDFSRHHWLLFPWFLCLLLSPTLVLGICNSAILCDSLWILCSSVLASLKPCHHAVVYSFQLQRHNCATHRYCSSLPLSVQSTFRFFNRPISFSILCVFFYSVTSEDLSVTLFLSRFRLQSCNFIFVLGRVYMNVQRYLLNMIVPGFLVFSSRFHFGFQNFPCCFVVCSYN